jgi:hypothetical protein
MAYISKALRELVTKRAQGRCEYCQTAQAIVIEMEVDHIVPVSAGGETVLDNLCLACVSCNAYKHEFQMGVDPQTDREINLFNPRTQVWSEHFTWSEDRTLVIGLTPTGRATVERLKMNREIVVSARWRRVRAGWHPPE